MRIDGTRVRALRERKAWSQEHLAQVSGLSVRTIQRVEAEGTALPETRLALATALGTSAAELMGDEAVRVEDAVRATRGGSWGAKWGWIGWGVGFAGSMAGIGIGYLTGTSAQETFHALGVITSIAGVTAGLIAVLAERARRGQTTA
jgi:transcriptional regulator with XRE-family HTH domain